jgi:hypothetical protein
MGQTSRTPPLPFVAIHVSELTQALDDSGGWYTSWHYAVMPESLKEALSADGTPWVEVSDADIAAGALLHPDGSPKYPIVISLAAEVVADAEIPALQAYANAGGVLFVGSSSFTRNPDGSTRGDFAIADDLGLHMANAAHSANWAENTTFSKVVDHRIVSHIPAGTVSWYMPLHDEEVHWGSARHYVWRVTRDDADLIANAGGGIPLRATKEYGEGRFIYHGALNPLIGIGGNDSGMYGYLIYRRAIEWAFEDANLPIVKLSPWRYEYDAGFTIRHDLENTPSRINFIKSSAQAEYNAGAKGDYYLCTGTVRAGSEDTQMTEAQKLTAVANLRDAVEDYGATIGSHNGGLPNRRLRIPECLQLLALGAGSGAHVTPTGYLSGWQYAHTSILTSYLDIEGWLVGWTTAASAAVQPGTARGSGSLPPLTPAVRAP